MFVFLERGRFHPRRLYVFVERARLYPRRFYVFMERETGFEPATLSLEG